MVRSSSMRLRSALVLGLLLSCSQDKDAAVANDGAGAGGQAGTAGSSGATAGSANTAGSMPQAGSAGSFGTAGQAQAGASTVGGSGGVAGQSSGGGSGIGGSAGAVMAGGAGTSGTGAASGAGGSAGTAGSAGGGADSGGTAGSSGATTAGSGGAPVAGAAGSGGAPGGPITIWIAGDSTVANGSTPCPVGWGKSFDGLFDDRVSVTNSAVGGRSVRNWTYNVGMTMDTSGECVLATDTMGDPTVQARWQQMLDGMGTGDYLFIQFGINDGDSTCDRHVGIEAFKSTYGMMAQAAKERGANPVFVTPVSSIACNGSTPRGTRGAYVGATQEAGTTYDVPVIDLHALSVALYTDRGFCPIPGGGDVSASTTGAVGEFFCDDHTHFSATGAEDIAGVVADAVRDAGLPLAGYLK